MAMGTKRKVAAILWAILSAVVLGAGATYAQNTDLTALSVDALNADQQKVAREMIAYRDAMERRFVALVTQYNGAATPESKKLGIGEGRARSDSVSRASNRKGRLVYQYSKTGHAAVCAGSRLESVF